MGYLSIKNLHSDRSILEFKECYAMEKLDGSSSHVSWRDGLLHFFPGCAKIETFTSLFDQTELVRHFTEFGMPEVVIFGEVYAGKIQGKSDTYGKQMKFCAFDVKIGENWIDVPNANQICTRFGLDFVDWVKIPTDLEKLDYERDKPSVQAMRNGCGNDKKREGIVLRPTIEVRKNNGERIIAKHKAVEFRETKTPRKVDDAKQLVLDSAKAQAAEYVVPERLNHVLQRIPEDKQNVENMRLIIDTMIEDVLREGEGEVTDTKELRNAIGKLTAYLFKLRLNKELQ